MIIGDLWDETFFAEILMDLPREIADAVLLALKGLYMLYLLLFDLDLS